MNGLYEKKMYFVSWHSSRKEYNPDSGNLSFQGQFYLSKIIFIILLVTFYWFVKILQLRNPTTHLTLLCREEVLRFRPSLYVLSKNLFSFLIPWISLNLEYLCTLGVSPKVSLVFEDFKLKFQKAGTEIEVFLTLTW